MSARNNQSAAEAPGPPDWELTVPEAVALYKRSSPEDQRWWFRKLVEASDPAAELQALLPSYSPQQRVEVGMEYRRLQARHEAQKMFQEAVRGAAEPPVVHDLQIVTERLELGLEPRPQPTVGDLLYPGRVNAVYGTHTAGKTWLGLYLARHTMTVGGSTLIIDYEDSPVGIAERCLSLDPDLCTAVHYVAPVGQLQVADLAAMIEREGITLVILDSVGESLAMGGFDSNSERDVTQWFTEVPDALAALGPAVLIIDHIAKKQDGTPTPVGSFRKSAAITGAQFALENKVGFSRDRPGWSKLTCTKDRNGYFATGQVVGRVDFSPHDCGLDVVLRPGEAEAVAVTDRIEIDVLNYVGDRWALNGTQDEDGNDVDGRPTLTQIRSGVTGDNTKIREAVDRLVQRDFLEKIVLAAGPKKTRDLYKPRSPFQPVPPDS